jgi:hypothetical protein
MTPARTCRSCGAGLDEAQRYCVACGNRCRDDGRLRGLLRPRARGLTAPVAPTGRRRAALNELLEEVAANTRRPTRRSATVLMVVVLGMGVLVGGAVSPLVTGWSLASTARTLIVLTQPALGGAQSVLGDSGPASSASTSLGAPASNVPSFLHVRRRVAQAGAAAGASVGGGLGAFGSPSTSAPSTPKASTPGSGGGSNTTPEPATVDGPVVHVSHDGHAYVVANGTDGELIEVHADKAPTVGQKVKATVTQLFNGTFKETKATIGAAPVTAATISGTVTFVDPVAGVYTLSSRGASLLVHSPVGPGVPAPPVLGTLATVKAGLTQQGAATLLTQTSIQPTGTATAAVDLLGIVAAVDPTKRTISLSADDVRESGKDLVVNVPAKIDLTKLKPKAVVDVTATIGTDGSYTLTGISDDSDATAAADSTLAQGDQAPAKVSSASGRARRRSVRGGSRSAPAPRGRACRASTGRSPCETRPSSRRR